MERRNFLKLPIAAAGAVLAANALSLSPGLSSAAQASTYPTGLKGFGHGGKDALALKQLESLNLDWYYGWSSKYPTIPTNFIPMIWGGGAVDTGIANVKSQLAETKTQHLLGFNEPDHDSQANMTTGDARRLWPKLEATGLRLGSPATISPNAWWMNRFMTDALAEGLRIDFVTCHIYQYPNVATFLRKIDELHERWGKPVWVTEYAVADWEATATNPNRYSRTQVNEYMQGTVEGMRARPYVERFAWKTRPAGDYVMGSSALFHTDGSLTSTGRLYASL